LAALAHGIGALPGPVNLYILDRDQTNDETSPTAWQLAVRQMRRLHFASGGMWNIPADASWEIPPCRDIPGERVGDVVSKEYGPHYFDADQMAVKYYSGYFGQAPVAAAFFDDVLQNDRAKLGTAVENLLADTDDRRVVVTGSLVGGTGAGCLPRFVEFLSEAASAAGDRKTAHSCGIMAVALLRWFGLGARNEKDAHVSSSRNAAMRSREPSALLYAKARLAKHAMTVLLTDPSPDSGTVRNWSGDTRQPAHEKLVVPHYAAAAASNFLFARSLGIPGTYGVVCPDIKDGLKLAGPMWLFGGEERKDFHLQIGNLVQQNWVFCERLRWMVEYLRSPPDTRHSWFATSWGVPSLEWVRRALPERKERVDLLGRLDDLLDAKWDALRRLAASDQDLFEPSRRPTATTAREQFRRLPGGVVGLAGWLPTTSPDDEEKKPNVARACRMIVAQVPSQQAVKAELSAARCLPKTVQPEASNANTRVPGSLEKVSELVAHQMIAFELVRHDCLPTVSTMEFFLANCCFGADRGGAPRSAEESDWIARWRLLLLGLCAGKFHLAEPEADDGAVKLVPAAQGMASRAGGSHPPPVGTRRPPAETQWALRDGDGRVVGFTSPTVLLVPSVTAPWNEIAEDPDLALTRDAARATSAWFDLLDLVRRNVGGAAPGWFRASVEWAKGIQHGVNPLDRFALPSPTIDVEWEGRRKLRLPVLGERNQNDMDALLDAFGIPTPTQVGLNRLPAELAELNDRGKCPEYRPFGPGADARVHRVVWGSRHQDLAERLRFGFALFSQQVGDKAGVLRACRVSDGVQIDVLFDERDILLDLIEPLDSSLISPREVLPDYPVKLRYVGLVDRTEERTRDGSLEGVATYRLEVRGLGQVTAKPRIGERRPGTYLLWPGFRTGRGRPECFRAYYMLGDSNVASDEIWIVGTKTGDATTLDWQRSIPAFVKAQPLYSIRGESLVDGGIPELFTVVDAQTRPDGIGMFRSGLCVLEHEDRPPEQWGVDFGTSSSVVAMRGQGGAKPFVLVPTGDLDQTAVISLHTELSYGSGSWFVTWDGMHPRVAPATGLFPSQMFLVTEGNKVDEAFLANAVDRLEYGSMVILDHGGKLTSVTKKWKVLSDLKWPDGRVASATATQRSQRRAYLLHLLEQAWSMRTAVGANPATNGPAVEAALQPGLPTSVNIVFTLPLRMRSEGNVAASFAEDVASVCRLLGEMTGRLFLATFMWESHAGAPLPAVRTPTEVFAVADLGGGSLDLWGGIGNNPTLQEYADSYRFGGHDLIDQWLREGTVQNVLKTKDIANLHREFQAGGGVVLTDLLGLDRAETVQAGFFELALEATSRWVAGLALEARRRGIQEGPVVNLSLLGMGWSLASKFDRDPAAFTAFIQSRASAFIDAQAEVVGSGVEKLPALRVSLISGAERGFGRKTYLARSAANSAGVEMHALLETRTVGFLGFDIEAQMGTASAWHHWYEHVQVPVGERGRARLAFDPSDMRAQPRPVLVRHKLTREEIERVLMDINAARREPPDFEYSGPAPFAMVIELLRTHTA